MGHDKKNDIKNPNADEKQSHIPCLGSMMQNKCFLPLQTLQTTKNKPDCTLGLSLEKCLSFGGFDLRYVLFWGYKEFL